MDCSIKRRAAVHVYIATIEACCQFPLPFFHIVIVFLLIVIIIVVIIVIFVFIAPSTRKSWQHQMSSGPAIQRSFALSTFF